MVSIHPCEREPLIAVGARCSPCLRRKDSIVRVVVEYLDPMNCGVPFEEQCLRFYETERAVNTASSEQVRQPIYTKAVHFWRNYEHHLEEMIQTVGPVLLNLPPDQQPTLLRQKG